MTRSFLEALGAFWYELRRRRVARVAIAYGAAGFGVMQVADTFFPALRLPDWSVTLVAVLVILGFPVALVLAWAFEITPEGIRLTGDVPSGARVGSRVRYGLVTLVVIIALAGAGAYATLRSTDQQASGASEVSAATIAVLPFRYSGGSEHAYLAEGIVNLLAAKIDEVGDLHSIDPNALFGVLAQERDSTWASPRGAERVARRLGAGQYVLGTITQLGSQLQIRATLYGSDGESPAAADVVAQSGEGVFAAVDEAARQLLAAQLGDGNDLVQLAALTTSSMPALRAYLDGERMLRSADGPGAAEAFERAIAEDSAFALAHWALAVAREWGAAGSPGEAAERAHVLRDQLPARARSLLDAYHSYLLGDHHAAESAYRAILRRTPHDVLAAYGLAEVVFHYAAVAGRLPTEAKPLFGEVIRFQPDHGPSLYHLSTIAAIEGDRATLDSVTHRFATLSPSFAFEILGQQAFATSEAARVDSVTSVMLEPGGPFPNFGFWALTADGLDGLKTLADTLVGRSASEQVRASARRWGAYLDFSAGRMAAARALGTTDDVLALAQRAYLAALPFATTQPSEARTLADELRRLSPDELDYLAEPGLIPGTVIRDFLLGMLNARLGDEAQARARASSLDTVALPPAAGTHATDLRLEVLALLDYVKGRHEQALATIESMPFAPGLGDYAFVPWLGLGSARLLRGELLAEAGREEEAVRWLEAVGHGTVVATALRAPAELALARIHDRRGDGSAAAHHYARFIDLWEDADPELQPSVAAARRRLAELAGER